MSERMARGQGMSGGEAGMTYLRYRVDLHKRLDDGFEVADALVLGDARVCEPLSMFVAKARQLRSLRWGTHDQDGAHLDALDGGNVLHSFPIHDRILGLRGC